MTKEARPRTRSARAATVQNKTRGGAAQTATGTVAKPIARKQATTKRATVPAKKVAATAARKSSTATVAKSTTELIATLAGISTSAVAAATGHGWNYWLKALDRLDAAKLPHKEIARTIYETLGLRKSWWAQMIAVGYEQARGLRKPRQGALGFAASVSRTIAVPVSALYSAWEEGRRGDWLPDAVEVRRATKNKSMRITWPDGSGVDVNFYAKGGEKAVVAIEQTKLPDEGAVEAVKQLWGATLDRLKSTLEGR